MRINLFLALLTAMVVGCAAKIPVVPETGKQAPQTAQNIPKSDDCHRLWGEYTWYVSANHDRIDVVPKERAEST